MLNRKRVKAALAAAPKRMLDMVVPVPSRIADLTGTIFGETLTVAFVGKHKCGARWLCRCPCGAFLLRYASTVKRGGVCDDRKIHTPSNARPLDYDLRDGPVSVMRATRRNRKTGEVTQIEGLIDTADLKRLLSLRIRWFVGRDGNYFQLQIGKRMVELQRWLMDLEVGDPLFADHINQNGLDNRRCNLRKLTPEENLYNRGTLTKRNAVSGYRGVYPSGTKWIVMATRDGKTHDYNKKKFHNFGVAVLAARMLREKLYGPNYTEIA